MTEMQKKGKIYLIVITIVIMALSLYSVIRRQELSISFLRLVLTPVSLYLLYQGYEWAKYLSGVICILTGFVGLVGYFSGPLFGDVLSFFIGFAFLFCGVFLFCLKSVKSFLEYQKRRLPNRLRSKGL